MQESLSGTSDSSTPEVSDDSDSSVPKSVLTDALRKASEKEGKLKKKEKGTKSELLQKMKAMEEEYQRKLQEKDQKLTELLQSNGKLASVTTHDSPSKVTTFLFLHSVSVCSVSTALLKPLMILIT